MSSSPHDPQDEGDDKQNLDELDEPTGGDTEGDVGMKDAPAKRGRGRPKGSKNKRPGSTPAASAGTAVTPRKRGRPPKEKKPDDEADTEPPTKRKRGRPPKNLKPESGDGAEASGEATDPSAKKKRGRPSKKATD
ncbi:hypothetical protein E4T56_gene12290 [Termitomyces sp. T112]|nr:hypothetical protein C0989_011477 [Termitomyces sp. Mn162]KAG5727650.1 hypothetical protein E4T56_gene12290 [Termitomyces sp. T112]KAH0583972.1 hypothetical protein H2248_009555 [Termitomyces sp. 'cryptogamus']KNZ74196.1 hypothetical protein J132_07508 [Termitomyces sp. J132]